MLQLPNRQKALSLMICQLLPATKLPGAEVLEASHPWQASSHPVSQLAAAAVPATASLWVEQCRSFTKAPKSLGGNHLHCQIVQ